MVQERTSDTNEMEELLNIILMREDVIEDLNQEIAYLKAKILVIERESREEIEKQKEIVKSFL